MDLTPGQRKAVFAVIVLALAALGAFLLIPGLRGSNVPPRSRDRAAAAATPLPSASPTAPASPAGGLGSAPVPGSTVNIYAWLPFTQAGLTAAADVVRQFAADYATYTYSESAASYEGRMRGLVTVQLAVTLARAYATPGVAHARAGQREIATGTGRITSLRAFGPASLTFVVAIAQKVTGAHGTTRTTTDYAVTVAGAGNRWQVTDIELASAGNT
jgi:hypothetical protein